MHRIAHLEDTRHSRWWEEAACRGMDPDMFFPEKGNMAGLRAALEVCAGCPVRDPCLDDAIRSGEKQGVRGGQSMGRRSRGRT